MACNYFLIYTRNRVFRRNLIHNKFGGILIKSSMPWDNSFNDVIWFVCKMWKIMRQWTLVSCHLTVYFHWKKASQKRENSITQQQFLRQWQQSLFESELVTSPLSLLSVLFLINTFDDDIKKSQMCTEKECSERDSMEWNCNIKQGWKTWTFFLSLYQFSTSMSSSKRIFNYLVFRSSTLNLISRLLL